MFFTFCVYAVNFDLIITLVYRDRMIVWLYGRERFIAILPRRLVNVGWLFVPFPPRLITGWSPANAFLVSTVLYVIITSLFLSTFSTLNTLAAITRKCVTRRSNKRREIPFKFYLLRLTHKVGQVFCIVASLEWKAILNDTIYYI